jgi:formylglycine-generating enzyme required for sulfatase activity
MAVTSIADFLALLQQVPLLDPTRLEQLIDHPSRFAGLPGLTHELASRGWLTSFQIERLLQGSGASLIVGPYVLLERLGVGGMGEVYKARHELLGRLTALKVMRGDLPVPEATVQRFQREARAAARLEHVNIVAVHDASQAGDMHYIAMELVRGLDLAQLVKLHGPLPEAIACNFIRQAAIGLQHAHEQGLIHRDIKPSNLMVTQKNIEEAPVIKILDFGLARFHVVPGEESTLTGTDQWLGTPDFIAPEQARSSSKADIRSDIFSLGCTLFFLLTGKSAFPGDNRTSKLIARLEGSATPVRQVSPHITAEVEACLVKMLARDPADRYQTPGEVAAALAPFAQTTSLPPVLLAAIQGPQSSAAENTSTVTATGHQAARYSVAESHGESTKQHARLGHLFAWAIGLAIAVALCLAAYFLSRTPVGQPTARAPVVVDRAERASVLNSIGMKMVRIEPGTFAMGSLDGESERGEDEGPQHEVEIKHSFHMGAFEVMQEEYATVMHNNPSYFSPTGGGKNLVAGLDTRRLPVERVSWNDAVEFCKRLSELPGERQQGRKYRLPTEEEWEYCCRAGSVEPFAFGKQLSSGEANFDGRRPYGGAPAGLVREHTVEVDSFQPNAWGLYNMHGNVHEWCQDRYVPYAEKLQPGGPGQGFGRVIRGGAWLFSAADCRSARRVTREAEKTREDAGFRVACDP